MSLTQHVQIRKHKIIGNVTSHTLPSVPVLNGAVLVAGREKEYNIIFGWFIEKLDGERQAMMRSR